MGLDSACFKSDRACLDCPSSTNQQKNSNACLQFAMVKFNSGQTFSYNSVARSRPFNHLCFLGKLEGRFVQSLFNTTHTIDFLSTQVLDLLSLLCTQVSTKAAALACWATRPVCLFGALFDYLSGCRMSRPVVCVVSHVSKGAIHGMFL